MRIGFFCFRQYLPHRIPSTRNLRKSVWKTALLWICFSSLMPTLMWLPLAQWLLSLEDKYTDIPISRYCLISLLLTNLVLILVEII